MKIFDKFSNKNVGKPGLTRLWGGGAQSICPINAGNPASQFFLGIY
ncbi:MAG: hypothetical protein LBJ77_00525 [Holosporales bacterium]|nr:hypothetical protein [Holosporales bacterium]